MVENGKKSWNCGLVLRPGVKSLKYKKIWLGGDPIASTQEFLDSSAPFGHLKDFYDFMIFKKFVKLSHFYHNFTKFQENSKNLTRARGRHKSRISGFLIVAPSGLLSVIWKTSMILRYSKHSSNWVIFVTISWNFKKIWLELGGVTN